MLDQAEQEKIQTMIKTNWYMYFAFVAACVMYIFVAYMTAGSSTSDRPSPHGFRSALIVLCISGVAANYMVRRMQADEQRYLQCRDLDEIIKKFSFYFFISLALCELPALFGLIMVFLTMRMGEWVVFVVIAAFLFAMSTPRSSVLEDIVAAHNERNPAGKG